MDKKGPNFTSAETRADGSQQMLLDVGVAVRKVYTERQTAV